MSTCMLQYGIEATLTQSWGQMLTSPCLRLPNIVQQSTRGKQKSNVCWRIWRRSTRNGRS